MYIPIRAGQVAIGRDVAPTMLALCPLLPYGVGFGRSCSSNRRFPAAVSRALRQIGWSKESGQQGAAARVDREDRCRCLMFVSGVRGLAPGECGQSTRH
jgi:hypothetical protein